MASIRYLCTSVSLCIKPDRAVRAAAQWWRMAASLSAPMNFARRGRLRQFIPLPNYGAGHCLWLMRCFWAGRRASFGRDGIIHTLIKRRHTAHQRRPETSSAPWNDKRPECEIIYSRYAARLITVCHRGPSLWTVMQYGRCVRTSSRVECSRLIRCKRGVELFHRMQR